jgi:N-acetylglucosamine-6-phosphate deacetylase
MFYLKGDLITEGQRQHDKLIGILNGKITFVGDAPLSTDAKVYETKGLICPGFVDLHIHGVSGFDFMDSGEAYREIANQLPRFGVTSFLATSRTAELPELINFLESAKGFKGSPSSGAQLLGVHIEGPWISPQYPGAQKKSLIRSLTVEDVEHVLLPYSDIISIISFAPEEVEDLSLIKRLRSKGICLSAGHTNATLEEIGAAIMVGLTQTTHTFNAMSPAHHRDPGTAAASLYYDELTCEVIADGLHVHPGMIGLLFKVKGREKLMLVSDCTGYNHLEDGEYFYRGKELVVTGHKVTLKDGTLAGSAVTLDKAVKYAVENCGIPLEDAVYMASGGPLTSIGKKNGKGRIQEGYNADIVLLNQELSVEMTIVNGEIVYRGE